MPIDMTKSTKILKEIQKELKTSETVNNIIEESSKELSKDELSIIEEATSSGMQMRSYESKKAAAIGAIAVSLAKKHKDPLYDRLKHFRGAWKDSKDQILQRYYSQATMQWQQGQNK